MEPAFQTDGVTLYHGDCLDVLKVMPDGVADAVVTDPPYGLEFMGQEWDRVGGGRKSKPGIGERSTEWVSNRGWNSHRCAKCGHLPHGGSPCRCESPDIRPVDNRWQDMQEWFHQHFAAILPKVKPGGYIAAFGGSRTYHRLACAVEDAGFEVRDCLMWIYGSGFPKGQGCLKPAHEPIILARRPGPKVLPLGVDECRVPTDAPRPSQERDAGRLTGNTFSGGLDGSLCGSRAAGDTMQGRYPANVLHDGSDEVMDAFAAFGDDKGDGCGKPRNRKVKEDRSQYRIGGAHFNDTATYSDTGTAARFFYCAKASKADRGAGNTHPTVKPLALMRWLVRLVCPAGGVVLDPFAGSGTTGVACLHEKRRCLLVEREPGYIEIIRNRLTADTKGTLFA